MVPHPSYCYFMSTFYLVRLLGTTTWYDYLVRLLGSTRWYLNSSPSSSSSDHSNSASKDGRVSVKREIWLAPVASEASSSSSLSLASSSILSGKYFKSTYVLGKVSSMVHGLGKYSVG